MIGRKGAWWGVAFVILLVVSAAMVSLPTAAEGGERIAAFYAAHKQLIVWQQIVGVLEVLPFLAFAASLSSRVRMSGRANRWLMPAAGLVAMASVVTSLVPLAMVLMANLSPDLAHQLTVVEDLADAGLFASLAAFVLAASTGAPVWVRAPAFLVAIVAVARATKLRRRCRDPTLGARACLGQRRSDRRRDSNGPPDHCQTSSRAPGGGGQ